MVVVAMREKAERAMEAGCSSRFRCQPSDPTPGRTSVASGMLSPKGTFSEYSEGPAAEMRLAGGSPGVGAHGRNPGEDILPLLFRDQGLQLVLPWSVWRPCPRGATFVWESVCDSLSQSSGS